MKRRALALVCGVLTFIACNRVMADPLPLPSPHVRLTNPGTLETNNKFYLIPQGSHILDEDTFLTVEREMKRLQEQETRLRAENKVLTEDSGGVSWPTLVIVGLGALALGATSVYFAQ